MRTEIVISGNLLQIMEYLRSSGYTYDGSKQHFKKQIRLEEAQGALVHVIRDETLKSAGVRAVIRTTLRDGEPSSVILWGDTGKINFSTDSVRAERLVLNTSHFPTQVGRGGYCLVNIPKYIAERANKSCFLVVKKMDETYETMMNSRGVESDNVRCEVLCGRMATIVDLQEAIDNGKIHNRDVLKRCMQSGEILNTEVSRRVGYKIRVLQEFGIMETDEVQQNESAEEFYQRWADKLTVRIANEQEFTLVVPKACVHRYV